MADCSYTQQRSPLETSGWNELSIMWASLTLGAILLVLSSPPLVLMAREVILGLTVARQYSIDGIRGVGPDMEGGALSAELGGHRVELSDDQPFAREPFRT